MSELDSNIPPPSETAPVEAPKRRGRPKGSANGSKAAKATKTSQAAQLEAALEFVSPVESNITTSSQYVWLANNMALMSNGQISAGHPIEETLTVAPHLTKLRAALKKCGNTLALTETENGQLAIKGEKLRAIVPCIDTTELLYMPGDPPMIEGNFNVLKEAFKAAGRLSDENGNRVIEASLLLEPNTCTGTDGHVMMQYWHGLSLPPGTVLPVAFTDMIAKNNKLITGLGGNWNNDLGALDSFTVWFEGGAWFKTQCYNDRWPDIAHILDIPSNPLPVPAGLFEAVEAIKEFLDEESNAVIFMENFVQSHKEIGIGAQYSVPELNVEKIFNAQFLKEIAPFVETIDLTTYPNKAMFFGQNLRGAIMAMKG